MYISNIFCIFVERIGRSSYLLTRVKSRHPSSSILFEINLIIRDMKSENEIWKPVVGLENRYMISSLGRVKRLAYDVTDSTGRYTHHTDKIMKVRIGTQTGYPQVNLWIGGRSKPFYIHRLIAEAFIPNPNNYPCVNHIDEDRSNSVLGNLEWCTYEYNCVYGYARERRRESLKRFYENHPEFKMNVKKRENTFRVFQYEKNGTLIKIWDGGLSEIERTLGKSSSVANCVLHRNNSAYGFVWRREGDPFSYNKPKKTGPKRRVAVMQFDLKGNYIRTFPSINDAADYLGKRSRNSDITNCCKGNYKTAHGYKWRYI